ncbi:hypothetical protein ACFW1M_16615 [Streptomyces inhibens]|uniref:hypothetical protein n=1 Tax=Streptomyces inhibens TaxID=2293571 RepID=UPI0036B27B84
MPNTEEWPERPAGAWAFVPSERPRKRRVVGGCAGALGHTSAEYEASGTTEAPMLWAYIGDPDDGKRCILTKVTAR